ncbi:MAG: phosphoribosylglycinamide formyltransferase [Bacteroidota bacterium]
MQTKQIAIFASGNGSNALNIIDFFSENDQINVALLLSNNPNAPIIAKAKARGIDTLILTNEAVANSNLLIAACVNHAIDFVVLAGYLRKIPVEFIHFYANKIINIHPSLLPKFGGRGMYGDFVHKAVIEQKESKTGITIHFVNEEFDKGEVIAQFELKVDQLDDLDTLRKKISELEMKHFPTIIEEVILNTK